MFPLRVCDEVISRGGGVSSENTVGIGTLTKHVKYDGVYSHVIEKNNFMHKTTCKYDTELVWTRRVETSVHGDAKQEFIEKSTGAIIFSIKLQRLRPMPKLEQNYEQSSEQPEKNLAEDVGKEYYGDAH